RGVVGCACGGPLHWVVGGTDQGAPCRVSDQVLLLRDARIPRDAGTSSAGVSCLGRGAPSPPGSCAGAGGGASPSARLDPRDSVAGRRGAGSQVPWPDLAGRPTREARAG